MRKNIGIFFLLLISIELFSQTKEIRIISHQPEQAGYRQLSWDKHPLLIRINNNDSAWLRGHNNSAFRTDYKYLTIIMQATDSICLYFRAIDIASSRRWRDRSWRNCTYHDTVFVLHPRDFETGFVHIISSFEKNDNEQFFTIKPAEQRIIKKLRQSKPQAVYDNSSRTIKYTWSNARIGPGESMD